LIGSLLFLICSNCIEKGKIVGKIRPNHKKRVFFMFFCYFASSVAGFTKTEKSVREKLLFAA